MPEERPVSQNTAYTPRPLSSILAPEADPRPEATSVAPTPAAPVTETVKDALPEKYRGKSVEQVADMHMNAERELGRVRNEVGTYRGLVQDMSQLQRQAPAAEPVQEKLEVSGDDLIQSPVETIRKVVKHEIDEVRAERVQDKEDAQFNLEANALVAQFPTLEQTISEPEFQTFVSRTPSRQADYQAASAQGTGVTQVRAARRLLEDYQDFQSQVAPPTDTGTPSIPAPTPIQEARAATTEGSGTSAPVSTKPLIYEADVIAMINSNSAKYRSPSFQTALTEAIQEGRYVKLA